MNRIEHAKAFARSSGEKRVAKGGQYSSDLVIDALVAEFAKTYNLERAKIEDGITKLELHPRSNQYSSSISFARKLGGGGLGHFPWPLGCHKTIELCWPFPDEDGMIACLEIEIPWPCMGNS